MESLIIRVCKAMSLPEKDYFYLQEIIGRWNITGADLRYFAEQGMLEIQTWLDEMMVLISRRTRTVDGLVAHMQAGVSTYKGYAIVEPDELRKIFSSSPQSVVLFRIPHTDEAIKVHRNHKPPVVGIEDLVISRATRDKFEKTHGIEPTQISSAATTAPSFGGRPSVMHMIMREFAHRCQKNAVASSLQKEADALELWAVENIQGAQPPKSKAIMNAIRANYREYRKPMASAASENTKTATA